MLCTFRPQKDVHLHRFPAANERRRPADAPQAATPTDAATVTGIATAARNPKLGARNPELETRANARLIAENPHIFPCFVCFSCKKPCICTDFRSPFPPTTPAVGGGDEESGSYFFTRMVLQPLFLQSFW